MPTPLILYVTLFFLSCFGITRITGEKVRDFENDLSDSIQYIQQLNDPKTNTRESILIPKDQAINTPTQPSALFFTPYNVVPGGGERYLLSTVIMFQQMGYFIHFIVQTNNVCQNLQYLKRTLHFLDLNINFDLFQLITIQEEAKAISWDIKYDIFVSLGNGKIPQFSNPAKFGIYICQFPFDLNAKVSLEELVRLSKYQQVWVNSLYVLKWYSKFILSHIPFDFDIYVAYKLPSLLVIYPPVQLKTKEWRLGSSTSTSTSVSSDKKILFSSVPNHSSEFLKELPLPNKPYQINYSNNNIQKHILMIGRVFLDRQMKNHDVAIHIFRYLKYYHLVPEATKLLIVGTVMPGHESWANELRKKAEGLPIELLFNANRETLDSALRSSLVFWHMTGIKSYEQLDPASIEHFGLSVVEAMSAGLIPIVLNGGGMTEIVDSSCGFLADDILDYFNHTIQLYKYSKFQLHQLRKAAIRKSKAYSVDRFYDSAKSLVARGQYELKFRKFISHIPVTPGVLNVAKNPILPVHYRYAAVIIEPRVHFAMKIICQNVLSVLGENWKLIIYFSDANEFFLSQIFPGSSLNQAINHNNISNNTSNNNNYHSRIEFRKLSKIDSAVSSYNKLLLSKHLWKSLLTYDNILIFQTDSFLIKKFDSSVYDYDYVGAPWCRNNEQASKLFAEGTIREYVGNGGLSLRNPRAAYDCLNRSNDQKYTIKMKSKPNELLNEDVYFVKCLTASGKKVAPKSIAKSFSIEVPCVEDGSGVRTNVSGVHALWYYITDQEYEQFIGLNLATNDSNSSNSN